MENQTLAHSPKETIVHFYDRRYQQGYMEDWDNVKKEKVREVLKQLELPKMGKALDFGCGNGIFTNIIKEILPNWDVYGVDISPTALSNAKTKFPTCFFLDEFECLKLKNQVDFLFTHHVIEHVQNLDETFTTINHYLKPHSYQLHILPCGNAGSYEHQICMLKKNGIEKNKGNRFFFEEPGHLRRLSTDEFITLEQKIRFSIKKEYYSNQFYGAINWITKSSPKFINRLTNNKDAISHEAAKKLSILRKKLLSLTLLQFAYTKYLHIKTKWYKAPTDYIKILIYFIPAIFCRPIYKYIERKSKKEWHVSQMKKNGSEMFLFFERQ